MGKLWSLLDGKKTYLGIAALFVLGGLLALNVIDQKTFEVAATFVSAWTGFSLRKAIS